MSRTQNEPYFTKLIAEFPELEVKGKKFLYTSINGHMFTYLDPDGNLGIRLSKDDHDSFVEEHKTKPFVQYGATMRGYVSIPQDKLTDTKFLKKLVEKSLKFIKSLPPK